MVDRSCKLCSLLINHGDATMDDQRTHAQIHASQLAKFNITEDNNGDQQVDLEEIFAKCFPVENLEKESIETGKKEIEKSRSTLNEICQRICKTKRNESKDAIGCQLCGTSIQFTGRMGMPVNVLRHACTHSTKKPFACGKCERKSTTKCRIVVHSKSVHKVASPITGEHFVERWAESFNEIKQALVKCFGDVALESSTETPPIELSIQRRSILSKTMKRANEAKKLPCNQCRRREIIVRHSDHVEQHIQFHMRQRSFECSLCDRSMIYKRNVRRHVAKEHGVQSKGNYVDHSDEHHVEIIEWLEKCFGKEAASK